MVSQRLHLFSVHADEDRFGHHEFVQLTASDGRAVTVFMAVGGEQYFYQGHSGPYDETALLGIVLPHDGGYAVCGFLGMAEQRKAVWDALYALGVMRANHDE
jgi:hypothetical protein